MCYVNVSKKDIENHFKKKHGDIDTKGWGSEEDIN
jgi:hypothetical protein